MTLTYKDSKSRLLRQKRSIAFLAQGLSFFNRLNIMLYLQKLIFNTGSPKSYIKINVDPLVQPPLAPFPPNLQFDYYPFVLFQSIK